MHILRLVADWLFKAMPVSPPRCGECRDDPDCPDCWNARFAQFDMTW